MLVGRGAALLGVRALTLALAGFARPAAAANCTRESLLAAADSYIAAQTAGQLDGLRLAADNFTYRENNRAVDVARGVLAQPLPIDLHRSTADTVACASYTMLISASSGTRPYVIATQIRHPAGDDGSTISLIDTIAATTGSLFFNATQTLAYLRREDWSPLPADQRPSRDLLRRYGDAYLDMWTDAQAADEIRWGAECERIEGSSRTSPCGGQLPHGGSARRNGDRRYVIDETVGSVDVLCSFDALGSLPDSHEIRVVNDTVRYVHTITV